MRAFFISLYSRRDTLARLIHFRQGNYDFFTISLVSKFANLQFRSFAIFSMLTSDFTPHSENHYENTPRISRFLGFRIRGLDRDHRSCWLS